MKNIEEVKKAIEFLKANTENDFEKLSVELEEVVRHIHHRCAETAKYNY